MMWKFIKKLFNRKFDLDEFMGKAITIEPSYKDKINHLKDEILLLEAQADEIQDWDLRRYYHSAKLNYMKGQMIDRGSGMSEFITINIYQRSLTMLINQDKNIIMLRRMRNL